jgi:hypothetical protein
VVVVARVGGLVVELDVRVVVVAPRELSDKVAGLLWKLINAANPATVATATIPALFIFNEPPRVFDSSRS